MIPGWSIIKNPDPLSVRKWVVVSPTGETKKWKTRKCASIYLRKCFAKRQAAKVRRQIEIVTRKLGCWFYEYPSKSTESYYFMVFGRGKPIKVRVSTHNTSRTSHDFIDLHFDIDKVLNPSDVRAILKKLLNRRKAGHSPSNDDELASGPVSR